MIDTSTAEVTVERAIRAAGLHLCKLATDAVPEWRRTFEAVTIPLGVGLLVRDKTGGVRAAVEIDATVSADLVRLMHEVFTQEANATPPELRGIRVLPGYGLLQFVRITASAPLVVATFSLRDVAPASDTQ